MMIQMFTMGLFQTNTYIVSDEAGWALLVDPACCSPYEQQALLRYLETNRLKVCALVATHGHLDHLWGAEWAAQSFGLPVLLSEADFGMVQNLQGQYDMFGVRQTAPVFPYAALPSELYGWRVMPTPGHTPGSVCLYAANEGELLSGDTLFCCGYGRTDLPGGNSAELIASLDSLFTLPTATRVWPGHGQATTIGDERPRSLW